MDRKLFICRRIGFNNGYTIIFQMILVTGGDELFNKQHSETLVPHRPSQGRRSGKPPKFQKKIKVRIKPGKIMN